MLPALPARDHESPSHLRRPLRAQAGRYRAKRRSTARRLRIGAGLLTSLSFAVSGGVFAGSAGESSIEALQAAQRAEMAESSGRGHEDLDRMLIQGWREANALASQSLQ